MAPDQLVAPTVPTPDATPDAKPKTTRRKTQRRAGRQSLEPALRSLFSTGGELWSISDPICGQAALEAAPGLAKAINLQCMENAKTYEFWAKVVGSGGGFGIMLALLPLVQTVAIHHGVPLLGRIRERRAGLQTEVPFEVGFEPEPEFEPDEPTKSEPSYVGTHANPAEFPNE